MIPIECPKCGRGGSVPPDRLNARLVCKACHTVFHLDNTGRMVLGEPESFDMKSSGKAREEVSSLADFDLAQTWNDIPAPVKYGVPVVILALVIWVNSGSFMGSSTAYAAAAQSIVGALTSNNRAKAISLSTTDSADAAGQWFDLIRPEVEKSQIGNDVTVNPQIFSGNPEKDSQITLMVVLAKPGSTDPPITLVMPMKHEGSAWLFDATQGLDGAQKAAAANAPAKK